MSSTVIVTGVLPFVILIATVLAFPICFALLNAYRRSVLREMSRGSGELVTRGLTAASRPPVSQIRIIALDSNSTQNQNGIESPQYRRALLGPWRASAAYTVAGVAYAVVMTAGWVIATRDQNIVWIKLLILFWTYFWPSVLTALLVAAYYRSGRIQLLGAYFAFLALLIAVALAKNPEMGITELPVFWVLLNGPATILLFTFLIRPIRAVGPLVVVFLIAVAIGSQTIVTVAGANENLLRLIAGIGFDIGLNALGVFAGMIVIGMLVFALLGWPLLRWLGKRYEQKKLSDQSITLDSVWLLFAITQSIGLAFESPPWILTGVVAFVAYKLVLKFALRWASAGVSGFEPRTLLLLRVFALAKRSERLFDKFRIHWHYAGSICMIAGPDLVTTTVEPHQFLDFVRGHLGRLFIRDKRDLEQRIASVDSDQDPDGRYRINEFFCHKDTWQMTMERLAMTSDAVLMDLRSFNPNNQGCIFELGRLVDSVDLNRVVFLVDDTTDYSFLESSLQRLWQDVSADSPNQIAVSPTVRLFRTARQTERDIKNLVRLLLRARAPA